MKATNDFGENLLAIPPNGLELNFTYHYYLGGRVSTEIDRSVFENDAFLQKPLVVNSVLPFRGEDIEAPFELWDKIRVDNDPLSQYLRRQFSASMREQLNMCKAPDGSRSYLQTILSNKLNQFLISNRFRSQTDYGKETAQSFNQQKQSRHDRVSLNRSLLERTYKGLISEKDVVEQPCYIRFQDLRSAQATAYFSDQFLYEIILAQFQISIENDAETTDEFTIQLDEGHRTFIDSRFALSEQYERHEGISSIEVTIWRYGFISLNIRLQNRDKISANHLLDAICHPELIGRRSDSHGQKIGELLVHAEFFRNKLDQVMAHALDRLALKRMTLDSGKWENLKVYGKDGRLTCSRPYVGTILFNTETAKDDTAQEEQELMKKKLVVGAARTTPAFLTKFDHVDRYLTGYRNVYGASGSIVYIARRGWCVLDSDERDKMAFRLGVVEATHIVINIINTAARAQRLFAKSIHKEGAFVFEQLNIRVKQMVSYPNTTKSGWGLIRSRLKEEAVGNHTLKELRREQKTLKLKKHEAEAEFAKWIAEATSFMARARLVSPFGDMTELLESHLLANTSRSAVHRCKYLTGLDSLRAISQEMMKNYTAFLKTSSNYLNLVAAQSAERTRKSTQVRMWLAIFGVLIGMIGWFIGGR